MKSLFRFDHRNILNQIPKPYIGTCQWITQDPEFRRWRQARSSSNLGAPESCRVLSIYGSPGVGKTVMSRYVLTYLRQAFKTQLENPPFVVYFFCDDKDRKRRTSLNLLRSLLFQILIDDKTLLRYISENTMEAHLKKLRDHSMETNELQDLWDALSSVIQRSRAAQFWIVIDALDELDVASRRDVIRQLTRILEKDTVGRLKVLLTDRTGTPF
jgi:Cdc6-like AAA superfamily ATPase